MVFVALFAALIAAGAFLIVPVGPVPVVLQNMFALLAGLVLGPALGAGAAALFVAAGAVGAPVFGGGGAGLASLLGPTGGYLLGYILGAFVSGLIAGSPKPERKTPALRLALAVAAGILAVYVPGLVALSRFVGWDRVLIAGFVPFIAGDAVKGILAVLVARRLRRTAAALLSR
ncbi:MAG: biotin transporter BioY [Treponema sp.]|nr:biotin transporter BioY [Treponema sp.]